jgi:hypothetical protein
MRSVLCVWFEFLSSLYLREVYQTITSVVTYIIVQSHCFASLYFPLWLELQELFDQQRSV